MKLSAPPALFVSFFLSFIFLQNQVKAQYVPSTGLIAEWKLNENTGVVTRNNANYLSVNTLNNTQWISGKFQSAINLSGSGSFLYAPNFNDSAFPVSGSLTFWIKADFTNQNNLNVFDGYRVGGNHIFIRGNNSTKGLQICFQKADGNYSFINLLSITPDEWTCVTIVWDNSNFMGHVYKNGVRVSSNPMVENINLNSQLPINAWVPTNQNCVFGNGFFGSLDQISLHNRVLSPLEIQAMYDSTITPVRNVTPRNTPQLFTGTTINSTRNSMAWSISNEKDLAGILVYKNAIPYTIVSNNTSQWLDDKVTPGSTNAYSVRAFDYSGNSSPLTSPITLMFDTTNLIFKSDFEGDQILSNIPIAGWNRQSLRDSSIVITNQSRAGNKAIKFNMKYQDWNATSNLRSEIISSIYTVNQFPLSKKWWIGFSHFIPLDWVNDFDSNPETIWQFHGDEQGPAGGSPPLSAYVVGDSIKINLQSGTTPSVNGNGTTLASFLMTKGIWTDWVIQVNFDLINGSIRVWKDCELIVDYTGPTLYPTPTMNNLNGPYLKFGIYKWDWGNKPTKVSNRSFLIDEVRIAKGTGNFKDVQPTGASSCSFVGSFSPSGLEGLWNLNEGAGSVAIDASAKKRDGVLENTLWTNNNGINTLNFRNNLDALSFPLIDSTKFPKTGSMSFWIYGDFSSQNSAPILDQYRTNANHIFVRSNIGVKGIQIAFQKIDGIYSFLALVPITTNTWTNITIVWDTQNPIGYVYKNGVLFYKGPIVQNVLSASLNKQIDTWKPTGQSFKIGNGFVGAIKEIAIYNRVLSDLEIMANYNKVMWPKQDMVSPSKLLDFKVSSITKSIMKLCWSKSTDSIGSGISGILLKRNDVPIAILSPSEVSYLDTGLLANNSYNYSIQSFDNSGNQSASSFFNVYSNSNALLFKTDFEADIPGLPNLATGWQIPSLNVTTFQVGTSRVRSGSRALNYSFNYNDWTSTNTSNEISSSYGGPSSFNLKKDWWVGFSEFIPANWTADLLTNAEQIWRFKGAANGPGSVVDPLSAWVIGDSIKIYLQSGSSTNGNSKLLATFLNPKGSWIDWVIKVNFDYSNGNIKIWKNCTLVVDYSGPTIYPTVLQNNENGPSLLLGINKPNWGLLTTLVSNRSLIFDEIRVGTFESNFNTIKPNGTNSCGSSIEVPSNDLLCYWKFSEGIGTTVKDETGNWYTGNMTANSWFPSGITESAASFSGLSKFVFNSELGSKGFPSNGSLSFWIKGDFSSQSNLNVFDSYRTNGDHIFIRTITGVQGLQIVFQKANGNYSFLSQIPVAANTWTFISVQWDIINQKGKVYKNGILVTESSILENVFNGPTSPIANWSPSGQLFQFGLGFTGLMDNIALYSRLVPGDELLQIYNSVNSILGSAQLNSPISQLVPLIKMENDISENIQYPNPTRNRFSINYNAKEQRDIQVRIVNIGNGKEYFAKKFHLVKGMNSIPIEVLNANNLDIYLISFLYKGQIFKSSKIIISK